MKQTLGTPYKGQTITVCKMNDIIPQVISGGCEISKADIEGLEFTIPTKCPICGGRLEVVCEVDTEVLICTNEMCEGKLVNRLDHFCGKKGLDIKGLSKATLGKLVDWGWVDGFASLYCLHQYRDEWINKPGFGTKSVDNILTAIENSRKPKLESFICALGIPHVGKTLSHELTKYFCDYKSFKIAAKDKWDFTEIDKVAYEKASAIWNFDFTEWKDAKSVENYGEGTVIENIVAVATNSLGGKYYMTEYSYNNNIHNGFNVVDCEDVIDIVTYTVKKNDNLSTIASKNNTTVKALVDLNASKYPCLLKNPDLIYEGWILRVK